MVVLLSWLSYRSARATLEGEFERRLEHVSGTVASQVSPADVEDARRLGEEGAGHAHLQVMLEELRAAAGLVDASIMDSARVTIYDTAGPEHQHRRSRLDSLFAGLEPRAARAPQVTRAYARDGTPLRAALAAVPAGEGRVAGWVAIESRLDYRAGLEDLRRTLVLITVVIAVAIGVLAVVVVRAAWSAALLERRLSRAENLAAMGRLTATLAHEIKNPLAIIRGSVQRLGKLEPEAQRMSAFVTEEVDRLTHTVGRYLRFARGEAPAGGQGDAAAALNATLDLLEGELVARRLTLARASQPGRPLPVRLDNESLKQVFLNLMLNAMEASPADGTITVDLAERHGRAEVRIADQGPGLPPEVARQLGAPFLSTKAQGTGLGLFMVRRLVESGGGELAIERAPGGGAACTVRLPLGRV